MVKIKKIRIPGRYLKVQKVSKTVALMNKKTGHMKGRTRVQGMGDNTYVRRVVKNVDLNKDGKPEYYGGTILGRTKKVIIKGSKRNRSYVRRI